MTGTRARRSEAVPLATNEQDPAALGAQLRGLRRRHATLHILTEIVHLDERMVAMRATVTVDGRIATYGHAAKVADRTGAFVAEAELLAVRQALLLGGFTDDTALVAADSEAPQQISAEAVEQTQASTTVAQAALSTKRQRGNDARARVAPSAAPAAPETSTSDLPKSSAIPASGTASDEDVPPPTALASTVAVPDSILAEATLAEAFSPAPRPRRERRAQRDREQISGTAAASQETVAREDPSPQVEDVTPPIIIPPPTVAEVTPSTPRPAPPRERAEPMPPASARPRQERLTEQTANAPDTSDTSASARPQAARRARSVPSPAATSASSASDGPPTQAHLRADWRPGRPIPAWWPPERPPVGRRVTKAQVERLRAIGLDEEITPAQLDTYSRMLFDHPVSELDQTQYAILEERLNRAYPSPLEETGARRLIYPIAVGDAVPLPPDRPIFVRWRDVPPEVAEEEPPKPAQPSWRTRGPRAGRRRSSR